MIGRIGWAIAASLALVGTLSIALGRPAPRQDDDEREETLMRGRHAFENNCLMCHAVPIVSSQRLTREQWTAEVTKMVGWGAPVADEDREPLLAFLNQKYGESVPRVRPGRTTIREAEAAIDPQPDDDGGNSLSGDHARGPRLFAEHCASCHGADAKGRELGVSLVDKPILDRRADFRTIVREGKNRMPGFKQALDRSAETDLLWWLTIKDRR